MIDAIHGITFLQGGTGNRAKVRYCYPIIAFEIHVPLPLWCVHIARNLLLFEMLAIDGGAMILTAPHDKRRRLCYIDTILSGKAAGSNLCCCLC
jgi:hypothetical protein